MVFKVIRLVVAAIGILLPLNGIAAPQGTPAPAARPLPFLSPLFGDNMVLQRGKPNAIWGWSEPGDHIQITIGEQTASAIAGADRRWQARIQPPPAGGPYVVKITGRETVELHNVLVGDVWLCGGQSNMQLPLRFARDGAEEAKAANYPDIRFFSVAGHPAYRHSDVIEGTWRVLSPETADWVSAVGYYFARKLQHEIHVPIGLVVDALGGTPAEAWTSADALRPLHDFDVPVAEVRRLAATGAPEYGNYVMHWYDEYDIGLKGNWAAPEMDDTNWKPVAIPGGFAELGVPDTPAVAWFRKEIVLPDPLPEGRAMLFLGSVERMDTAFVNGKLVGANAWVENPRVYPLGEGLLKPGRNVLAIRVLKTKPDGGFLGKPAELRLVLGDKSIIPLAGAWKGQLSLDARPPRFLPIAYENWPVMPAVLYEGMLAPIAPLSITGALWYQGEQNSARGYQYRRILPVMIADWRRLFGQSDFPFYIVSLPAFKPRSATPVDDPWAETRESQALTAASVSNSCLAVTIDTGDPDNIHAKDKQPVGERLALCALAKHYGKNVVYSGPTLASVDRLPGAIRLHFANADGGLVMRGTKLEEFTVAGEDRKWYWADAHIEGDTVLVSSPSVANPKEVRYAWQSNPAATLFGITESQRPY
jgi:sialate O-acetylesterase